MASIDKRPNGTYLARYRPAPNSAQKTRTFKRKVDAQRWLDEMTAAHRHRPVRRPERRPADRAGVRGAVAAQPGPPADDCGARRDDAAPARVPVPRRPPARLGAPRATSRALVKRLSRHLAPGHGRRRPPDPRRDLQGRRPRPADRGLAVRRHQAAEESTKQAGRAAARRGGPGPDRSDAGSLPGARHAGRRHRAAAGRGLRAHRRPDRLPAPPADRRPPARSPCPAGRPTWPPPKTQASVRTVPLPQVVVDALGAHLATWPADGFVFTTELGAPIRRTAFSARVWRPAVQAAGLPAAVTFHALRHFYASLLIRHGESVKTVQARLGHASAAETLDTYSHLWPDSDDRTRAAVDSVLSDSEDSLRTAGAAPRPQKRQVSGGRRTSRPVRRVLSTGALRPPDGRSSI